MRKYSRYMQRVAEVAPQLVDELAEVGARFTHHTLDRAHRHDLAVAGEQCLNGIEPSFAHHYFRNVIRAGQEDQGEGRCLLVRAAGLSRAGQPRGDARLRASPAEKLPDYFTTADESRRKQHVDIQAAAQKWVD